MSGFDYERSPVQRIRVSIEDTKHDGRLIDVRVCYLGVDYKFVPTKRGFSIPVDEMDGFIDSMKSVQAYALEHESRIA